MTTAASSLTAPVGPGCTGNHQSIAVALLVEDGGGKGGSGGVVSGRADTTFDAMVETAQKELRLHVAVISSAALTEEEASGSARRRRAAEALGVCATETSQPFSSALASFRMSCGESVSWRTSCAPAHPRWPTCTRCHDFSGWGGDTSSRSQPGADSHGLHRATGERGTGQAT